MPRLPAIPSWALVHGSVALYLVLLAAEHAIRLPVQAIKQTALPSAPTPTTSVALLDQLPGSGPERVTSQDPLWLRLLRQARATTFWCILQSRAVTINR